MLQLLHIFELQQNLDTPIDSWGWEGWGCIWSHNNRTLLPQHQNIWASAGLGLRWRTIFAWCPSFYSFWFTSPYQSPPVTMVWWQHAIVMQWGVKHTHLHASRHTVHQHSGYLHSKMSKDHTFEGSSKRCGAFPAPNFRPQSNNVITAVKCCLGNSFTQAQYWASHV